MTTRPRDRRTQPEADRDRQTEKETKRPRDRFTQPEADRDRQTKTEKQRGEGGVCLMYKTFLLFLLLSFYPEKHKSRRISSSDLQADLTP